MVESMICEYDLYYRVVIDEDGSFGAFRRGKVECTSTKALMYVHCMYIYSSLVLNE